MPQINDLLLPPVFIRDSIECDCDIGTYVNGRLTATRLQIDELRNRAEFYASTSGPDLAPRGLKAAAKGLLKALTKNGY